MTYRRINAYRLHNSPARLVEGALAHLTGHEDGGPTVSFGITDQERKEFEAARQKFRLWLDSWVVPCLVEAHNKLTKK